MIKSKYFWLAAIAAAIIPILLIDISQHYIDWQKEVREELIVVVQNMYSFTKQQKADVLDKAFERNQTLMFLIYLKSFLIAGLLGLSIYFFRRYKQQRYSGSLKPIVYTIAMATCFVLIKLFLVNRINTNNNIKFLTIDNSSQPFQKLYSENFNGKVVYIDFWGTTCGPCLQEFRNFTSPIKDKYRSRRDIDYLYIALGNEYLWREQIRKYNIEGAHVFLGDNQYQKLYQQLTKDSSILMPHYVIADKNGNIVESTAKSPSEGDSLYVQLDKYLLMN